MITNRRIGAAIAGVAIAVGTVGVIAPAADATPAPRFDQGRCSTFVGTITIVQCAPTRAPDGHWLQTLFEDGSATYWGSPWIYDHDAAQFRFRVA